VQYLDTCLWVCEAALLSIIRISIQGSSLLRHSLANDYIIKLLSPLVPTNSYLCPAKMVSTSEIVVELTEKGEVNTR
jgi:hypothetical protein